MTSATHGGFESPFVGPMIPVGELLRRERPNSSAPDSQARRALGGVAVGAALAFGAVVGGLVLQHPHEISAFTGGATGGIPGLTDEGNGAAPGLAAQSGPVAGQPAPGVDANTLNGVPVSQLGNSAAFTSAGAGTAAAPQTPAALPDKLSGTLPTTGSAASASSSSSSPAATSSAAPSSAAPSTASASTAPATPAPAASSAPAPTSTATSPGLLGTVSGVLHDVVPFQWFN